MKRQFFPSSLVDLAVKILAYLRICFSYAIQLVGAYFVGDFPQNFLSHLTNTTQMLHGKSSAGVAKNSSEYLLQICLTFTVDNFACLDIF